MCEIIMKLYIIKRKNSAISHRNLIGYSMYEELKGGFYIKAVHAFLKKKDAKEYLDSLEGMAKYREIITIEV